MLVKAKTPGFFFLTLLLLATVCRGAGTSVAETYPHYAERARAVKRCQLHVDDGDTFTVGRQKIRILGIDTPEISNPEHGFFKDQPYGRQAKNKAEEIFSSARVIEYVPFRHDSYGRLLAHVFVDGELFAVKMIEARLAYETVSHYGDNGFPDLARRIQRAAEKAGRPPFMEPYRWRRINRNKR